MAEEVSEKQGILGINFENLAKIANVEVKLMAQLGGTKIPLKTVLDLDAGSIVELDIREDEPIEIFVDKVKVAKGQIVTIDNCYAVKITEILHNM